MGSKHRQSRQENKRRKHARQRQQQQQRSNWDRMMAGDIGPMTYQGRVITPEIITEMRAADPKYAHQLDAAWERDVLDNNAPWLKDPQLLAETEELWSGTDHLCPICNGSEPADDNPTQAYVAPMPHPESSSPGSDST